MTRLSRTLLQTTAVSSLVAGLVAAWGQVGQGQHVLLPPSLIGDDVTTETPSEGRQHEFSLRHIYHQGSHRYPNLLRKVDVHPDTILVQADGGVWDASAPVDMRFDVSSETTKIQRLVDRTQPGVNSLLENDGVQGQAASLPPWMWSMEDVPGPNVSDKKTVVSFAWMAANAYILEPGTGEWEDVKGGFNYTENFGWEEDGLRGHIFADTTNSTVVIGLKGTSMAIFDGADTTGNDKLNDNLFGSCCCGQGGRFLWKQVCDCQTSTFTCNNTCLTKSLREKSHYYHAAQHLYHNVTARYPNADVWLTGHSLGGVVTSLLGLTFGLPTITFEAFPDALAASRLGLPTPPGYRIGSHQDRNNTGIHHFGHTADPVYMGSCNTASSACTIGGYAFESQCHTGRTYTYDTVADLGWRVGIGTHSITSVIRDVLKKYDTVPSPAEDTDCVDCFNWKYYESNGTSSTTTSSTKSSKTSTRTATCHTPGWWGCLDETTTSPITRTSTVTTTTCLTPGWFGCRDETNTTYTTTITTVTDVPVPTITTTSSTSSTSSSSSSSAVSCATPGWFGCEDPTSISTASVAPSAGGMTGTKTAANTASMLAGELRVK